MGTSNTYMGHLSYTATWLLGINPTCTYLTSDQADRQVCLTILMLKLFDLSQGLMLSTLSSKLVC